MLQNVVKNVISNQIVRILFFLSCGVIFSLLFLVQFPEFNESLFGGVVEVECDWDDTPKVEPECGKDTCCGNDELFAEDECSAFSDCKPSKKKDIMRDCSVRFTISPSKILRGQVYTLVVVLLWSIGGYCLLGFYPKILNLLVDDTSLYKELSGEWILDYLNDSENNILNTIVDYRDKKKRHLWEE